MPDADAYFEPVDTADGGAYRPTTHTQGPWDPGLQHFGPPGALLARELERCAGTDLSLARISYDILGPVPLRPLTVRAWVERPGRRVRLVRGELRAAERTLVYASAWCVLEAPDDVPADGMVEKPPAPRADGPATVPGAPAHWRCGFLESVEWSFVHGGYGGLGPAAVWLRPRLPLLPDEPMSPFQRTVLSADSANGVSAVLDIRQWGFVPPELTVHLLRPPVGEWLCLDAETSLGPGRAGLATATLYDEDGPVARSAQSLLVHRR
ncbi:thioesterase family protein [Streptantibioticus rubrisoli]|uniref:Thioesterase family protein n=1 Tax=Streptantibioticus rubrisoli TaxID=1387313 RepID=A0ABT1PIR5_9ACTN|nr:thioesterase family protein [Streptantibioticus rubrisoli]MCQ4045264.1 thioesterase family protein [Streptantibioticus rubrisoli]